MTRKGENEKMFIYLILNFRPSKGPLPFSLLATSKCRTFKDTCCRLPKPPVNRSSPSFTFSSFATGPNNRPVSRHMIMNLCHLICSLGTSSSGQLPIIRIPLSARSTTLHSPLSPLSKQFPTHGVAAKRLRECPAPVEIST